MAKNLSASTLKGFTSSAEPKPNAWPKILRFNAHRFYLLPYSHDLGYPFHGFSGGSPNTATIPATPYSRQRPQRHHNPSRSALATAALTKGPNDSDYLHTRDGGRPPKHDSGRVIPHQHKTST